MNTDEIDSLKSRLKAIIEKVKLIFGRSLEDLIYVFNERNYDIRMAGECVRDLLMYKDPKQLELVSSATIPEIKQLFDKKHVSITDNKINGAITLVDVCKNSFTIATIRPDGSFQPNSVATKFKAYWKMNAYRRMFRVDSMFLDFDGRIYDYFNGLNDILSYKVRMNDDPDMLLKEDFMRMWRYFKLFGLISNGQGVHDEGMIKAITANMNRLANMNGELIWREMKMILRQPKREELLKKIFECGGDIYFGLPDDLNFIEFREVIVKGSNFHKHPLLGITYLCAFFKTREDVLKLHQRLRLSAYERDLAIFLVKHKEDTRNIDDFVYYREMCRRRYGANRQISKEYVLELLKYHNKKLLFQNLLETELSASFYSNDIQEGKAVEASNICEDSQCQDGLELFSINSLTEVPLVLHQETEARCESEKKRQKVQ